MQKRLIIDHHLFQIIVSRLVQELIENHDSFENTVLLGLQPRGVLFAERIKHTIQEELGLEIKLGYLDTTFYRDDIRRRKEPPKANETKVNFIIEDKQVILIDDVLYTGRTIRAALDAMIAFGRPAKVELLTMINRKYKRHLPIEADYIGKSVNTLETRV